MVLFRYIRKCYKSLLKKFLIILTCVMLVFAPNIKNTKAFFLVDDLTVVAILGGLCALGGVVLTTTSFKDNASEVLTNAVNSYVDYYGGLATDAYEKVKEVATDIYASGCVLASDFNDWIHGWLGDFVNTYVLQNYSTEGTVGAPIFSGTNVFSFNPTLPKIFDDKPFYDGRIAAFSDGSNPYWVRFDPDMIANGWGLYFNLTATTITCGMFLDDYKSPSVFNFFSGNGLGSLSSLDANVYSIMLTSTCNYLFNLADGTQAYFNHETNKWSRDMEGTLELDPGVFNTDVLGDIDIAPPYTDGLLDNTLDYTNYWVLGQDLTYDDTGRLTFPGTLEVPKDLPYDKPWDIPGESDYPLVIPGEYPIVNDIPKDDVVDRYPDIPITTTPTYTADWSTLFPFCIPFDLFKFLEILSANPQTPKFEIDMSFLGVNEKIDIDLTPFDGLAAIARIGFDLLFIVGLAMVTRSHLIRA